MNEKAKASTTRSGPSATEPHASMVGDAKHALERATGHARERIGGGIESKREKAVDAIGGVAQALRKTSTKLKEPGPLPTMADRAADTIDEIAEFINKRTLRDVVGSVEGFARREPAMFIGGALAAGLVAARFLKSSGAGSEHASSIGDEQ